MNTHTPHHVFLIEQLKQAQQCVSDLSSQCQEPFEIQRRSAFQFNSCFKKLGQCVFWSNIFLWLHHRPVFKAEMPRQTLTGTLSHRDCSDKPKGRWTLFDFWASTVRHAKHQFTEWGLVSVWFPPQVEEEGAEMRAYDNGLQHSTHTQRTKYQR